jgi:hypothetical protein
MADSKELGITVTGDVQDAQDKLSDLVDTINNMVDKAINITVSVDSAGLDALETELTTLDNETISPNVDSTAIQDLSTNASIAAQEIMDTSVSADDLSSSLMSIDSTAINEAASAASALGTEMSNAAGETANMSSNMSMAGAETAGASASFGDLSGIIGQFSGAAGSATSQVSGFAESLLGAEGAAALLAPEVLAVVAAVAAVIAVLSEAIPAAGEFQDSWSRLGEAVDMGGVAIGEVQDAWTGAINTMKTETGRSAGVIREHIISMGLAGVESQDLIIDSFSGISGAAFVTGNNIDTIEQAFRRVVSTGVLSTRQLMAFGLTTDDVFKATGMTMDQVRDKFQSLDAEGRTALLNQILNAKYGTTANEAYKNSWQHLGDAMSAAWKGLEIAIGNLVLPIVIPAMNALIWVVNGVAWAINTAAGWFNTLGDALNLTSTQMLMMALGPLPAFIATLTPLGWAISFISQNLGRLTADWNAFWTMIASGDWGGALTLLISELKWAFVDAPLAWLASLPGRIGEFMSAWLDTGKNIVNWIVTGLISLEGWLAQQFAAEFGNAGVAGAQGAADGFSKWLDDNGWKIVEIISDFTFQILPLLIDIGMKAAGLLMLKILHKIEDDLKQLPNLMYTWGKNAFDSFVNSIIDSIPGLRWALDQVKKLFPHSPPKEGPLSDITAANMGNWMSSIMDAGMDAAASFNLNNVSLPTPNPTNIVNSNRVGGAVFNINVPMQGTDNGDKSAVETGKEVGKGIVSELEGWALNSGISTVNWIRSG